MSERDTQNAIIDLITLRGGIVTRVNSGSAIFKRDGVTNVIRGAEKGTADILACYLGNYIAVEVKYGKNKATAEQKEFGRRVTEAGGIFIVAYDTIAVEDLLDKIEARYGKDFRVVKA